VAWDTWGGGVCRGQYPRVTSPFIFLENDGSIYTYFVTGGSMDDIHEPLNPPTQVPPHTHTLQRIWVCSPQGYAVAEDDASYEQKRMDDLERRIAALERTRGRYLEVYPLTEIDRSHDVAVGARVDPRCPGL
jgi:hypothetical protein